MMNENNPSFNYDTPQSQPVNRFLSSSNNNNGRSTSDVTPPIAPIYRGGNNGNGDGSDDGNSASLNERDIKERRRTIAYLIYAIVGLDAISFVIFNYFLPDLISKQFRIPQDQLSVYVGLVLACYSFSRFLSSIMLGFLSDLYGRKWLLTMSLLFGTMKVSVIGLTNRIWLIILMQIVHGSVSSTVVLSKCILADLTQDELHDISRVSFYGEFAAVLALSRAFSSGFGGLVLQVEEKLHVPNPYHSFCFIAACITGTATALSLFVPETFDINERAASRRQFLRRQTEERMSDSELGFRQIFIGMRAIVTRTESYRVMLARGFVSFSSSSFLWYVLQIRSNMN